MTCNYPQTYNDDTWASIESPDQQDLNLWLKSFLQLLIERGIDTAGIKLLHIGTGTSSIRKQFGSRIRKIDGLTVMESEIEIAKKFHCYDGCKYNIFKVNKYDIKSLDNFIGNSYYDIIVDNNLKQHGCCESHWQEFFQYILQKLSLNGFLLTHSEGFQPHTNLVTPLTLAEIDILVTTLTNISDYKFVINEHSPFVCNQSSKIYQISRIK